MKMLIRGKNFELVIAFIVCYPQGQTQALLRGFDGLLELSDRVGVGEVARVDVIIM